MKKKKINIFHAWNGTLSSENHLVCVVFLRFLWTFVDYSKTNSSPGIFIFCKIEINSFQLDSYSTLFFASLRIWNAPQYLSFVLNRYPHSEREMIDSIEYHWIENGKRIQLIWGERKRIKSTEDWKLDSEPNRI